MVAEEVGFEPTVRFHARRFSRPVQSTTLPLLRLGPSNHHHMILKASSSRGFLLNFALASDSRFS